MFLCPKKLLMGLLFMLLASSVAFQAVRSVLGGWIATQEGLPKVGGLFVHALVFIVLGTMIWRMPFGASNFEGMDDEEFFRRKMFGRSKKNGGFFKAAKRAVKEAEGYEDDDGEEYESDDDGEEYEDEGEEDFRLSRAERRAKRAAKRAARRAARAARRAARAAEQFNQPDPSKMHAGVYH
jgi:hypothetical protein